MFPNRSAATVPLTALSFPGSGHTCVSCPHPSPLYLHNTPWTRNDCPSKPAFVDAETAGKSASSSGLLTAPSKWISQAWVEPSLSDEHAQAERSVPPLHNWKTRISHECWLHNAPLSRRSISGSGIWEPIQCDTDNAISCVITYGICSLLPPYVCRCCGNNSM